VHVGLNSFNERGSWDNGTWYNQEGKFDWAKVNRFEVSTEYAGTAGKVLWFDNIHITNLDTALVREGGIVGIGDIAASASPEMTASPNPFDLRTVISYYLPYRMNVSLDIISLQGGKIRSLVSEVQPEGYYTSVWDGRSDSGASVPGGVYLCWLSGDHGPVVCRIIKS
jgi:hypothetical protein